MNNEFITRFAPVIQSLSRSELNNSDSLLEKLRIAQDGDLSISYVPFEHINSDARVVIVGITPGKTQLLNAVREARVQLDRGAPHDAVLREAKKAGAFSGAMRPNLIALLDRVGLHRYLGLGSCGLLFGTHRHLAQTTSVLRNAVFVRGGNYNGKPDMVKTPLLRRELMTGFAAEARQLSDAVFVPLGGTVADALLFLASEGHIRHEQILEGLPHPAGANAERIAFFLGRKAKELLSVKTDPEKIERARAILISKVETLANP